MTEKINQIELPPMPQVVSRILQIDENKVNVSSDQLQLIISSDPALSMKILKIANSAFYARGKPVANLSQALTLLGFKTIKSLSLLVSSSVMFPKRAKSATVQKEIWMRSVLTALVAKITAEQIEKRALRDEIFMTGLLRRIGQLILLNNFPDKYSEIYTKADSGLEEKKLFDAETAEFLFSSYDMTEMAMQKWNFPELYVHSAKQKGFAITVDSFSAIETENPMILPVIMAEYVVILSGYTETTLMTDAKRDDMLGKFGDIATFYKLDAAKQKYILEDLRDVIKQDSFYSFCGELFSS